MDFGYCPVGTEILDAECECGVELGRVEKIEESALGVDAGDYSVDGNFFTAGENDSCYVAIFDANVTHFGVGANFRAGMASGFGKCAGQGTETSVR